MDTSYKKILAYMGWIRKIDARNINGMLYVHESSKEMMLVKEDVVRHRISKKKYIEQPFNTHEELITILNSITRYTITQ